jgi:hypothetical protein
LDANRPASAENPASQVGRTTCIASNNPREGRIDMLAAELITRAEACPEFHDFCKQFDTWGVQSWLRPGEKALHFGVGAFGSGDGTLLEVGTFEGASALFTMAGLRHRGDGKLYSIDPHLGAPPFLGSAPWQFTLERFRANSKRAGLDGYVQSLVGDSQTISSVWPSLPIDSALIDGDHSYEGCLRDVECWATKLRVNGTLLIDDAEDPALPELLQLIEELKQISGLEYEGLIEGVAVFRRTAVDAFAMLQELKALPGIHGHRPWDMEFVQGLVPIASYAPETVAAPELRVPYQLAFLARCEPGDYIVSANAPESDAALADALVATRGDGSRITIPPSSAPRDRRCRVAICGVDEAECFAPSLLPGGLLLARSAKEPTYENSVAERAVLLGAGLVGCGWGGQIHWGFARPHFLSMDAVVAYIERNMQSE